MNQSPKLLDAFGCANFGGAAFTARLVEHCLHSKIRQQQNDGGKQLKKAIWNACEMAKAELASSNETRFGIWKHLILLINDMPFKHLFCRNKKQWRTARTRHSFGTGWIWVFMSCPNWQTLSNNQQSIIETNNQPTTCRSRGRIITASMCAEIFLKFRLLHFWNIIRLQFYERWGNGRLITSYCF